jgi:hypothetical protein
MDRDKHNSTWWVGSNGFGINKKMPSVETTTIPIWDSKVHFFSTEHEHRLYNQKVMQLSTLLDASTNQQVDIGLGVARQFIINIIIIIIITRV